MTEDSERCNGDIVLSIGLNVGLCEPTYQLENTLNAVRDIRRLFDVHKKGVTYVGCSSWEGTPERFIQLRIIADGLARPRIYARLARLACYLRQQTIAVSFGESWILVHQNGDCTEGGALSEFPIFV